MKRAFLPAALALLLAPCALPAAEPGLTLEQKAALRCSAAFAIVAGDQQRGLPAAQAYPPLQERGKEYFVRTAARLMDDLSVPRESVEAMLKQEVERLLAERAASPDPEATTGRLMGPCLLSLDASGI